MSNDRNPGITRDKIENLLREVTGFAGDQAVLDAVMLTIDAYATGLAYDLAASPVMVREGYVHLLMQQAELLLDSGGRTAQAVKPPEHVTFLTGLTDGMTVRQDQLAGKVAALAAAQITDREELLDEIRAVTRPLSELNPAAVESLIPDDIGAMLEAEAEEAEAVAEREEKARFAGKSLDALAEWERDLLNQQKCVSCRQWKALNAENWWRASASPTGYERKECAACRRAAKNARRQAARAA